MSQDLECAFQELNNDISEAKFRMAISTTEIREK